MKIPLYAASELPFDMKEAVTQAYTQTQSYLLKTPVEYSPWLSRETGAEVWLKLEHLQITGSFKLRGAANKLLSLDEAQRKKGIITASTGNHGAAVAYMGEKLGIPVTLYLPETVSSTKVEQIQLYPAELRYAGKDSVESELAARAGAQREQRAFVSPYNDAAVMAGQGTVGLELADQVGEMDAVFVPVGGGGLISGIAGYLKGIRPEGAIIGCQPSHSQVMYASVKAGKILDLPSKPTLSDGTAGGIEEESLTFPYCQQYVDDWALLSEEEIRKGLIYLIEKHYFMVEGAAALSVAALRQQASKWKGKKVVLILCGRKLGKETLLTLWD